MPPVHTANLVAYSGNTAYRVDVIDNKSALAQVMAWCQTGVKPLPEPMLTQFTDAYMHHMWELS